jgi:hypothetical protein
MSVYADIFHLPFFGTRLSESPTDKLIFVKKITAATTTAVTVPFKEGTSVGAILLKRFTVTNGEVSIALASMAPANTEAAVAVVIGQATELD